MRQNKNIKLRSDSIGTELAFPRKVQAGSREDDASNPTTCASLRLYRNEAFVLNEE